MRVFWFCIIEDLVFSGFFLFLIICFARDSYIAEFFLSSLFLQVGRIILFFFFFFFLEFQFE